MNLLSNLKIGTRLGAAFAAVLALTLIVGLFSISRLAKVQDNVADMATNWMVGARALGDYNKAVGALPPGGGAVHPGHHARRVRGGAKVHGHHPPGRGHPPGKRYEPTIAGDDERKLAQAISSAQAGYMATLHQAAGAGQGRPREGRRGQGLLQHGASRTG